MAVGTALLSFGWLLQAQTQTYYTEFDFTWWVTVSDYTAQITTTWWVTWTIQVALTNREKFAIEWHFDVVDAVQIDGGVWACQDKSTDDDVFGHHFTRPADFTLNSGASDTYTFSYNFPRYYSGNYMWCILYYETDTARDINTTSRKALLVSAQVASAEQTYTVKVYPWWWSTRPDKSDYWYLILYNVTPTTQNAIDWNSWSWVIYSEIYINGQWQWSVDLIIEPWYYNVVYKSQSSLSSFLSWVYITWDPQLFDFTTWDNLIWTQFLELSDDMAFLSWQTLSHWFDRYQRWWDILVLTPVDYSWSSWGSWLFILSDTDWNDYVWSFNWTINGWDQSIITTMIMNTESDYCGSCRASRWGQITLWVWTDNPRTFNISSDAPFFADVNGDWYVTVNDIDSIARNQVIRSDSYASNVLWHNELFYDYTKQPPKLQTNQDVYGLQKNDSLIDIYNIFSLRK